MNKVRGIVLCLLALAAGVAFGKTTRVLQPGTHNWNDADAWSPAGVPVDSDSITLHTQKATADKTLVLTNDVSTLIRGTLFQAGLVADYRARFVGTNCVYAPAAPLSTDVPSLPHRFLNNGGDSIFNLSGGLATKPLAWSDFDVDICHGADAVDTVNFTRGTFNYWDPAGTPTTRTVTMLSSDLAMRVVVGPGATLQAPAITMSGAAGESSDPVGDKEFVFNGATGLIQLLTYSATYPRPHDMSVILTNGADVTVGALTAEHATDSATYSVDDDPLRYRLVVEDSKLTATGAVKYASRHGHGAYDVRLNRATVVGTLPPSSGTGLSFDLSASPLPATDNRLIVRDSTIVSSNAAVSIGSTATTAPSGNSALDVSFSGSTLASYGLALGTQTGSLGFTNCFIDVLGRYLTYQLDKGDAMKTAYFKDCTVTNAQLSASSGGSSRLVFDGGRQYFLNNGTGAKNLAIVITNGAVCVMNKAGSFNPDSTSDACTQRLDIVDASFTFGDTWLSIGYSAHNPNGHPVFHLGPGGTATVPNFYVGFNGNGHMLIEGGSLTTTNLKIGNGSYDTTYARGFSTYVQTGGDVSATSGIAAGCATSNGHDAKVVLDGGTFKGWSVSGKYISGTTVAILSANGGTLKTASYSSRSFVGGFSTAELGPKGLSVWLNDTKMYYGDLYTTQIFQDKSGEKGLFRVTGASGNFVLNPTSFNASRAQVDGPVTLKLTATTDASDATLEAVNGGTLSFQDSADVTAGTLLATGGSTVKVTGSAALTVGNFAFTNATLVVEAGRSITVTGALDFENLTVKLSADPTAPSTNDLFVITGALPAATVKKLSRAIMGNTYADGLSGCLLTTYDAATGKTTVRFAVSTDRAPLADETTWKGATGDLWNDGVSGWTDGVPTASNRAVFAASESAAKAVAVPAGATVGALGFTGDGYLLAGERLTVPTFPGAAVIESAAAAITNEIASDVLVTNGFEFAVGAGSQLKVSGAIDASNFTKTGTGELVLSGANDLGEKLIVAGGRTVATSAAALGSAVHDYDTVRLQESTLRIDSGDGSETVVEQPVQIATTNARMYAILDCQTPVTIRDYRTPVQGGLLKRGPAPLTIEVTDGQDLCSKRVRTANSYSIVTTFDLAEDGSSPAAKYTNIAGEMTPIEGDLIIRRAPGETGIPTITMSGGVPSLGVKCAQSIGTPRLVLDGVNFDHGQNAEQFNLQCGKSIPTKRTELVLVNGARLWTATMCLGNVWANSSADNVTTAVALTNATLQSGSSLTFNFANVDPIAQGPWAWTEISARDSQLLSDVASVGFDGGLKASLANSELGPSSVSSSDYATFVMNRGAGSGSGAWGYLELTEGSVFRVNAFSTTTWHPCKDHQTFTLSFDDSTWDYGTGDFTLASSMIAAENRARFIIEMRGAGVRLAPPAGTTFTTELAFSGEGGLIVDGPGTVKFAADTLKFTGAAEVRQGTLDAGGQAVSVTLTNLTGANVPTLNDCAVSGRITVDLADASLTKGETYTVARLTGSTPHNCGFRAVNRPSGIRPTFAVDADGNVKMTAAAKSGVAIVIR